MIAMQELTDEQKKEVDTLFDELLKGEGLPFKVMEKENYLAIYSTNPYAIKALVLEAFVSLIKRQKG